MKSLAIIVGIIVVVFFITIGAVYFIKNNPIENSINDKNYFPLSILAIDENHTQRIAEIFIYTDGFLTKSIKTDLNGYESVYLQRNKSYKIVNKGNKYFYSDNYIFNYDDNLMFNGFKVNFPLVEIGNLNINYSNKIEKEINFTVTSNKTIKNIIICIRWSSSIISSKINNFKVIDKNFIERIKNKFDRCYDTEKTLKNKEEMNLTLISYYGSLKADDYIRLIFIDGDDFFNKTSIDYGNIEDNFAEDKIIEIK